MGGFRLGRGVLRVYASRPQPLQATAIEIERIVDRFGLPSNRPRVDAGERDQPIVQIARIADPVLVDVPLGRGTDVRTVVARIADAVPVRVGLARVGKQPGPGRLRVVPDFDPLKNDAMNAR